MKIPVCVVTGISAILQGRAIYRRVLASRYWRYRGIRHNDDAHTKPGAMHYYMSDMFTRHAYRILHRLGLRLCANTNDD